MDILPIPYTSAYICKMLNIDEESEKLTAFFDDDNNSEQIDLIGEILSLEHSIYLLRRCNGICGSHIDNIASLRRKLIKEYEIKFSEWFSDNNEKMW